MFDQTSLSGCAYKLGLLYVIDFMVCECEWYKIYMTIDDIVLNNCTQNPLMQSPVRCHSNAPKTPLFRSVSRNYWS